MLFHINIIMELVNMTGGFLLISVNLINIIYILKVKKSDGISLLAMAFVLIGLGCTTIYSLYLNIMTIFVPLAIQVFGVIIYISLVRYYKRTPKEELPDLKILPNTDIIIDIVELDVIDSIILEL